MLTKHTIIEGRYISAESTQPVSFKAVGFKSQSVSAYVIFFLQNLKHRITTNTGMPKLYVEHSAPSNPCAAVDAGADYYDAIISDANKDNSREKMLHDIELLEKILNNHS